MVVIIDYGMGNLFSVENALQSLGAKVKISNQEQDIVNAERLILPGVGAFPDGMNNLQKLGLREVLNREVLEKGKPILGICLGMQLFATTGEEYRLTEGLDWIPGRVRKFIISDPNLRIPHIGWNDVAPAENSPLFKGISSPIFYFVHSYHLVPQDHQTIAATCFYGEKFGAAFQRGNIFGTQFHPEKSQKSGLTLLKNFLSIN